MQKILTFPLRIQVFGLVSLCFSLWFFFSEHFLSFCSLSPLLSPISRVLPFFSSSYLPFFSLPITLSHTDSFLAPHFPSSFPFLSSSFLPQRLKNHICILQVERLWAPFSVERSQIYKKVKKGY